MSEDIEQSESSEQSSVQSDHSASAFFGWAQQDSRLVPAWIYDEGSPQYNRCRITNQHLIPYISSFRASLICSENVDLNRDTERLLPQVLRVVTNYQYLAKPGVPPSEADRGHAMDTLGFDLWDLLSSGDLQYRLEHSLQLPQTNPMQLYETKPDSAVFFRVFDGHGLGYSAKVELACSSLAPASANESFVIHWATEFKQEHSEQETKKRLFRPLVSGLYQRRAFGFPDHYVFGTAHHSTTTLEAFAATWEMPAKRKAPESDSTVYSKAPSACTGHWICFNFIC